MNAFEFSVGIKYLDMSFKKLLVQKDDYSQFIYEYKSNLFWSKLFYRL